MGGPAHGAGHGPGTAHKGKLNRRSASSHLYPIFQHQSLTQSGSLGNKKDNITVIYTPWSNLKKDGSMDAGQVSFHDQRKASIPLSLSPSLLLLSPTEQTRKYCRVSSIQSNHGAIQIRSSASWFPIARTPSSTASTRPKSRRSPILRPKRMTWSSSYEPRSRQHCRSRYVCMSFPLQKIAALDRLQLRGYRLKTVSSFG